MIVVLNKLLHLLKWSLYDYSPTPNRLTWLPNVCNILNRHRTFEHQLLMTYSSLTPLSRDITKQGIKGREKERNLMMKQRRRRITDEFWLMLLIFYKMWRPIKVTLVTANTLVVANIVTSKASFLPSCAVVREAQQDISQCTFSDATFTQKYQWDALLSWFLYFFSENQ